MSWRVFRISAARHLLNRPCGPAVKLRGHACRSTCGGVGLPWPPLLGVSIEFVARQKCLLMRRRARFAMSPTTNHDQRSCSSPATRFALDRVGEVGTARTDASAHDVCGVGPFLCD